MNASRDNIRDNTIEQNIGSFQHAGSMDIIRIYQEVDIEQTARNQDCVVPFDLDNPVEIVGLEHPDTSDREIAVRPDPSAKDQQQKPSDSSVEPVEPVQSVTSQRRGNDLKNQPFRTKQYDGVQVLLDSFNSLNRDNNNTLSRQELTKGITDSSLAEFREEDSVAAISRNFDTIKELLDETPGTDKGVSIQDLYKLDSMLEAATVARRHFFDIDTNSNGTLSSTEVDAYRDSLDVKNPERGQLDRLSRELTSMASMDKADQSNNELSSQDMNSLLSLGREVRVPGIHDTSFSSDQYGALGSFARTMYDAFDSIDQDHDGAITEDEAASSTNRELRSLLASDFQRLKAASDENGSKTHGVTRSDLRELVHDSTALELSDNFGAIDMNDNGLLKPVELRYMQHEVKKQGKSGEALLEAINFALEHYGQMAHTHNNLTGISKEDLSLKFEDESNVRPLARELRWDIQRRQ